MVQYLITNSADMMLQSSDGSTPMHTAVRGNRSSIVDILFENCAGLDAQDALGRTPSHHAAETHNSHPGCFDALLGHGADLHARDHAGNTILHVLAQQRDVGGVVKCLNKTVDLNMTNQEGQAPIHMAATAAALEVLQVLVVAEAEPQ